ncbi:DNA (cytosine-5)-methyltransferase CMT3-like isoform X1 [Gossypium australe]|uniref:DNA (Cytosine-5)-methyltransferase CMT3-like isoform X1 n=1 Tax=Gossypium australe TaxID=47621 RepID=A0A5B6VN39_9ROSI|nr:DNA (cytosine-5)-methyltransferase CMT3-like isoform X1 [Gossypium australe]
MYTKSVKAADLMVENPGQFVCDSGGLKVYFRVHGLTADEVLERRRLYFLLPMELLYSVLTEEETSCLSCKADKALKYASFNIGKILPVFNEFCICPFEAKSPPQNAVNDGAKDSVVVRFSKQRSWKPALETIDDNGDFSAVNMDTAVAICTLEATYKSSADVAAVETMILRLTEKASLCKFHSLLLHSTGRATSQEQGQSHHYVLMSCFCGKLLIVMSCSVLLLLSSANLEFSQAEDGEDCYICKIVEMFEAVDGDLYFTAQWFYRAQDTVLKMLGHLIDEKRVFFLEIQDDNPLDCLVAKLNIANVSLNVDLEAKSKEIPSCDYYCDMLYKLEYSSFTNLPREGKTNAREEASSTISDDSPDTVNGANSGSEDASLLDLKRLDLSLQDLEEKQHSKGDAVGVLFLYVP